MTFRTGLRFEGVASHATPVEWVALQVNDGATVEYDLEAAPTVQFRIPVEGLVEGANRVSLVFHAADGSSTEISRQIEGRRPPRYSAKVLGHLGGGLAIGRGISPAGLVVGGSVTEALEPSGFLWGVQGMMELPPLGGDSDAHAMSINDDGLAVGFSGSSEAGIRAVLWRDGDAESLALPGAQGRAFAVNAAGQIGGTVLRSDGRIEAYLWHEGAYRILPSLVGGETWALGLDEEGNVVGWSASPAGKMRPVIWRGGSLSELPAVPGHEQAFARSVGSGGEVVGAAVGAWDRRVAVLWRIDGGVEVIGAGSEAETVAEGVNAVSQVVGYGRGNQGVVGFLWHEGTLFNLNDLVTNLHGMVVIRPSAINDRGEIVVQLLDLSAGVAAAGLLRPDGTGPMLGPARSHTFQETLEASTVKGTEGVMEFRWPR